MGLPQHMHFRLSFGNRDNKRCADINRIRKGSLGAQEAKTAGAVINMNKMLQSMAVSAALVLAAGPLIAQEQSTNRVASKTDWSVFVEDNPTQCWIVSSPKETVNTRDGRVVAVTRSETLMFVSYWPGAKKLGEVSFTGGYPYPDGATVNLKIGDGAYELFTSGETAWAPTPGDDNKIISAMKRGAKAVITGTSKLDTTTKDTFSLTGFTAALEDASKRCGG